MALVAVVDGALELDQVIACVAPRLCDVLPDRIDDRRLVLAPFLQVRTGPIELRQHLLAPLDAIGRTPHLEQPVLDELAIVDRTHARSLGEGARILEAAALDRLPDHDRLGFLSELGRDVEHRQRQCLSPARQLEAGGAVVGGGERKKPEILKRKAAPVGIVVLDPERLVTLARVGKMVEHYLSDLAPLFIRERRLHARRFAGDMLDDLFRRSTGLDRGALHDEIDRAQREILHVEAFGDRRVVLEDHAPVEREPRDRFSQRHVALLTCQRFAGAALGWVHGKSTECCATGRTRMQTTVTVPASSSRGPSVPTPRQMPARPGRLPVGTMSLAYSHMVNMDVRHRVISAGRRLSARLTPGRMLAADFNVRAY